MKLFDGDHLQHGVEGEVSKDQVTEILDVNAILSCLEPEEDILTQSHEDYPDEGLAASDLDEWENLLDFPTIPPQHWGVSTQQPFILPFVEQEILEESTQECEIIDNSSPFVTNDQIDIRSRGEFQLVKVDLDDDSLEIPTESFVPIDALFFREVVLAESYARSFVEQNYQRWKYISDEYSLTMSISKAQSFSAEKKVFLQLALSVPDILAEPGMPKKFEIFLKIDWSDSNSVACFLVHNYLSAGETRIKIPMTPTFDSFCEKIIELFLFSIEPH